MKHLISEIETRRSIRKYQETDVSDEDIRIILEAARLAPSGSNTQPWRFLVVRDRELKEKIVKADHEQTWMLSAPVFIVCMADMKCRCSEDRKNVMSEECNDSDLKLIIRDTAIATEHLLLQSEHLGLSTCQTAWFTQEDMHKVLEVPKEFYICGVTTLGYADESPEMRPRKKMEEIVRFDSWNKNI